MTLYVDLHDVNGCDLNSYVHESGVSALKFTSKCKVTGRSGCVSVRLPRPIAEEIHRAMMHHFTPAVPAEADQ